jgi:hypothetical protein
MGVDSMRPRPKPVVIAVSLLASAFAVRLIWVLAIVLAALPREALLESEVIVYFAGGAVSSLVFGGFLAALAFRRRWAYVLCLAFAGLGLLVALVRPARLLEGDAVSVTLGLLMSLLWLAAVVLLLQPSSRAWYGFGSPT